jgi:hypothetical protein
MLVGWAEGGAHGRIHVATQGTCWPRPSKRCRTICNGETVIDVLSPRPQPSVPASIIDVGTSSLKLKLPFFVSPGSLIRIHLTEFIADAEVRHCTCEDSEYHVGVDVVEIVPKDQTGA